MTTPTSPFLSNFLKEKADQWVSNQRPPDRESGVLTYRPLLLKISKSQTCAEMSEIYIIRDLSTDSKQNIDRFMEFKKG